VFYTKYCRTIAEYDIQPLLILSAATFVAGGVLLGGGLHRVGRSRSAGEFRKSRKAVSTVDDDKQSGMLVAEAAKTWKQEEFGSVSDVDSDDDLSDDDSLEVDDNTMEELACFNLCVRAHVEEGLGRRSGPCCFTGFRSCRLAQRRTIGPHWRKKNLPRASWDCGLCIMFQLCIGIPWVLVVLASLWYYAFLAPTYTRIEKELDSKWGFVLEAGHEYTAPVWMGEFGTGKRGTYWVNFVRYLAERDVDWGYWPLNPEKLTNGYFDDWGHWHPHPEQWDEDTYSVLELDYMTVREPWRQLDLHALRQSPAAPVLNQQPCQRSVLGSTCGG